MSIELYKDKNGFPRVNCSVPLEVLGSYLEQDLQRSISSCDEIIQIIESIQQGKQDSWEGTGNAHTVTIEANSTKIFNEFSDTLDPCSMATDEFKNAIISWRKFIEQI
jgi:uncharacterized protein YacL (UPF0231 family)